MIWEKITAWFPAFFAALLGIAGAVFAIRSRAYKSGVADANDQQEKKALEALAELRRQEARDAARKEARAQATTTAIREIDRQLVEDLRREPSSAVEAREQAELLILDAIEAEVVGPDLFTLQAGEPVEVEIAGQWQKGQAVTIPCWSARARAHVLVVSVRGQQSIVELTRVRRRAGP